MDASEIHAKRINAKEVLTPMQGEICLFPVADGTVKNRWRRSGSENIHLNPGEPRQRRRTRYSSRRIRRVFNAKEVLITGKGNEFRYIYIYNSVSSNGRISHYFYEGHIERSKSLAKYIPRLCIVCVRNLERRHYGRRH